MRNLLDANDIFGEIKMWHDGIRKKQVGVVVESKINETFFRKHFQKDVVFFGFNGRTLVQEVIEIVNKLTTPGILGIIDADFRRILDIGTIPNLVLTDHHDTEMMLFNSRAMEEVIQFYVDNSISIKTGKSKLEVFEAQKKEDIKSILLKLAYPIGCIRLLNEKLALGLVFKTVKKGKYQFIDYSKFITKNKLEIDIENLKQVIENKSSKPHFFKNKEISEALEEVLQQKFDPLELCNGHDVINIFSLALERAISNRGSSKKIGSDEIEKSLIIAYRFEDFQNTKLYSSLRDWDGENIEHNLLKRV